MQKEQFKITIQNLKYLLNFAFLIFNFTFFAATSHAASFNIPEKLVYDLTWTGVKAGEASLEILENGEKLSIISRAWSAKWISIFYKVDDRTESTMIKKNSPPFVGQPVHYRLKIREGRHRRDKEIIFNHVDGKATYINHLDNERRDFDVPPIIFDPLSSFYYLRTFNLEVGRSVFIDVFDSKKVWNVEIQVLRKERLELPSGTFDTIVVKPLMKSEGIFSRKGDILIWLTDDEKRIPVKMQTKIAVGLVTATLVGGSY